MFIKRAIKTIARWVWSQVWTAMVEGGREVRTFAIAFIVAGLALWWAIAQGHLSK